MKAVVDFVMGQGAELGRGNVAAAVDVQQGTRRSLKVPLLPAGAAEVPEGAGSWGLPGLVSQHGAQPAQPGGRQPPEQLPRPPPGLHQPVHRQLHRLL